MLSRLESRAHVTATHCNALQRTATHCNALQRTATHCNTLQRTATHCNTLQRTATHCNALQRTTTYFNTLQHTPIGGGSHQDRNQADKWVNMPQSQRLGCTNSVANTRIEWRRPIGCIKLQVIFFAKEPLIIGLFYGKRPAQIRHPMVLCHPVSSAATSHNEDASPIWNTKEQLIIGLFCGKWCIWVFATLFCQQPLRTVKLHRLSITHSDWVYLSFLVTGAPTPSPLPQQLITPPIKIHAQLYLNALGVNLHLCVAQIHVPFHV